MFKFAVWTIMLKLQHHHSQCAMLHALLVVNNKSRTQQMRGDFATQAEQYKLVACLLMACVY